MGTFIMPSRSALIGGSITAALLLFWIWKRRNEKTRPTGKFESVGTVSKLVIYPVKSLPGVQVDSVECTKYGLKVGPFHDRQFMIATNVGGFVTQRQEPSLALTSPTLHDDELWIDGPEMKTLKVRVKKHAKASDTLRRCRVWGGDINGLDCGEECALWFQKYLKREDVLLVQYVQEFKPRSIRRLKNRTFTDKDGGLLYHDDGCVHIFSEGSVEDLNSRLEEKITYRNFRPSILVAGPEAFSEDNWQFMKVGATILTFLNFCSRCVFTTVNPETGVKTEKEPLDTLKTYRQATEKEDIKKFGQSPLFGIYMGLYSSTGFIKIGDVVSAIIKPQ